MKLFSSFFKNKKILIFGLLFFAILIFSPKIAYASPASDCQAIPGCVECWNMCVANYCGALGPLSDSSGSCMACKQNCLSSGISSPAPVLGPDIVGNATFGWTNVSTNFFVGTARSILWFCWRFAQWIGGLFSIVMTKWVQDVIITKDANFTKGWVMIRDFSNMLIVLGFVVIGIATSLRIQEYQAKKLLPLLILIALLINFSGLFCGLLIDASNITFKYFTQGDADQGPAIVNNLARSGRNTLTWDNANTKTTEFVTNALIYSIMYIAVALTYIYLSAILIIRYAVLAMLYILSPIAFTFWVFPASKKLWTEWWNNFLKWCFVGVIGGFFLNIAGAILPVGSAGNSNTWSTLIIALLFMVVGFKMTAKSSGLASMAAGAVMGLAGGAAGLAMGAVGAGGMATLKGLGKASGMAEAGKKIGHGVTRLGEKAGLIKSGTSAKWEKESVEKDKKHYENMTSADLASDVNRGAVTTVGRKANDIKARILAERGDFDKVKESNREAVATRAISNDKTGDAVASFRKANPLYAALDTKATKELTRQTNPATGVNYTQRQAEDKLIGAAFKSADVEARSKFSPDTIYNVADPTHRSSRLYVENTTAKQMGKAGERMSEDRKQAHKQLVIPGGVIDQMLADPANAAPAKQLELNAKKAEIIAMH